MLETLVCDVAPRVDAVSPAEWQNLFPDLPDSLEMIQLIQRVGVDGFRFHSIVVREDERPILLLPLFEMVYDVSTLVEPAMQPILTAAARKLPQLLRPRLLGVGFVEAEWGQVGVDPSRNHETMAAAWDLALKALDALAEGLGAHLIAFVNFTPQSGRMLPMGNLTGFGQIAGLPFAQTPITYSHSDKYIESLSANMRSSLRRKLRKAKDVKVLRTRQPGPWLDALYQFYVETCQRSDVKFSVHSRGFFASICQRIDDAEYALYFVGERLAAFRLQIVRPDCLIDKYFGMDPVLGREYSLYFVSWVKDIEYCIANQIPLYHSGLTAEDTKARLGAQFIHSRILFRHRQPLVHCLLTALARRVGYQPSMGLPPVRLGSDWDAVAAAEAIARGAASHGQTSMVHDAVRDIMDSPLNLSRLKDSTIKPADQAARYRQEPPS